MQNRQPVNEKNMRMEKNMWSRCFCYTFQVRLAAEMFDDSAKHHFVSRLDRMNVGLLEEIVKHGVSLFCFRIS